MIDFYYSFEPTRYDIWIERLTLHIHCGIIILEFSLTSGPPQTPADQRQRVPRDVGVGGVKKA
jgi:hypothetical protein